MTTSARVRWLDGTVREVELKEEANAPPSIASLRRAVAALSGLALPPTRKSCKLYLRGAELRDDSSPLQIGPGETVACLVRAESKRNRRRREAEPEAEEEGEEEAAEVEEETEARPVHRPRPRPPVPEEEAPPEEEEEYPPEDDLDDLLPPALRSLDAAFRILLKAYDFVSRRQLRATLELLASVAAPLLVSSNSSSRGGDVLAAAVDGASMRACASLCPEMISLRGGGGGAERRRMIGASTKPPPLSPTTALLGSVVAAAPPCSSPNDDGEGQRAREALNEGSPFLEISKIRTRGASSAPFLLGLARGEGGGAAGSSVAAPPPMRTRAAVFRAALFRAAAAASTAGLPRDASLEGFVRAFEAASRGAKKAEEERQQEEQQRGERKERERQGGGEAATAAEEAPSSSAALASLLRADDARHQLSVADFVEQRIAGAPWYSGQVEHGRSLRPRAAKFLSVPGGAGGGSGDGDSSSAALLLRSLMTPPLLAAAAAAGVADGGRSLYEHQARALLLSSASPPPSSPARRPFIVVAPTAAGKSLCFVLPMLRSLLRDPFATALLLYPTKALAADQLTSVRRALVAAGLDDGGGEEEGGGGEDDGERPPVAALFDGDVPAVEREKLLPPASSSSSSQKWSPLRTRVLLANPDVVHASLLPAATAGGRGGSGSGAARFVAGLSLVAVDEAHSFSGAFACHTALVLRRLRRACEAAKALVAMGRATKTGGGGRRSEENGGNAPPSPSPSPSPSLSPEAEADAAAVRPPPLFVAASATIGNPGEHAAALLPLSAEERAARGRGGGSGAGGGVEVIQGDGSAAGAKTFLLWNPPTLARGASSTAAAAAQADIAPSRPAAALPSKRARQEAVRAAVREAEQARCCGPRLQLSSQPPSLPDPSSTSARAAADAPAASASLGGVFEKPKEDPFGLPREEWLAAARLGKVRARAAAGAAAGLPPPLRAPRSPARALAPPAPAASPPPSPGRGGRYLAPLTRRAPSPFAGDDCDEGAPALLPLPALLSMEEVQKNQEELAAGSGRGNPKPSSGPRSLMLVVVGGRTAAGAAENGAFDAAAALLLRRRDDKGGRKKPVEFNISNGGLPSPSSNASAPAPSDSAAAAASLASAVAAREAGEAAARRSNNSGGGLPRWRERHGAAGVAADDRRSSAIVECGLLLAECCRARLRTLAFCKTRKLAELVAAHASQALREFEEREEKGAGGSSKRKKAAAAATTSTSSPSDSSQVLPPLSSRVAAYRAGYDPKARRAIEQALSTGRVLGVAATNALELGVDLPNLDVTLHLGVPPKAATLAQQSGRAGRRDGAASLHVVIAFDGPLDQWYVRHPERLFGRAPEPAGGGFDPFCCDAADAAAPPSSSSSPGSGYRKRVDEGILALHVACAAAECGPLDPSAGGHDARLYFGPRLPVVAAGLVKAGVLVGGDWWTGGDSARENSSHSSSTSAAARGKQRQLDIDRDAAAEAVVARGTPLYFAAAAAGGGSGNGTSSTALAPPSAPLPSPPRSLPHSTFGLRAIDETRFSIVDEASGALLEEMEASKAFFVV